MTRSVNVEKHRVNLRSQGRRVACVAACVGLALCAGAELNHHRISLAGKLRLDQAYYDGRIVSVKVDPLKKGDRPRVVGPWYFGPRVDPHPNDRRPNLYVVCPGSLHQIENNQEYDHNEVLSAAPQDESDFDVWWVVVLDPSLKQQFHSEKELILAAQQEFRPAQDFSFDQIPGQSLLQQVLKIKDVDGLERFRRPDGSMSRIAIVNAHFSIRAHIEDAANSSPAQQQAER